MMPERSFPLDAWYAAAFDTEVTRALLSRKICGKKILFYRKQDGAPVALEDACWHRLLPLSLGRLQGDDVVCGYHGLAFNADGRCTHMPSQETIAPSACVRSYPVIQRHRLIWVWTGDPALADAAKLPDMHHMDDREWAGDGGVINVACNYRLVLDNLLDLTHETFVHSDSIGDRALAEAPFDVTYNARGATVSRWMLGIEPVPFFRDMLVRVRGVQLPFTVDRWQIIHFEPPCTIVIEAGSALSGTGAPRGDRSQGVDGRVMNTITPEDEGRCHYFWGYMRNYLLAEQQITADFCTTVRRIFAQDVRILEAQQIAVDENPDRMFYDLNIDGGAVRARKLIHRMIEKEAGRHLKSAVA